MASLHYCYERVSWVLGPLKRQQLPLFVSSWQRRGGRVRTAAHTLHVYRWPVQHKKWQQKPTDPSHLNSALHDSCFFEYFVETANGFVNGTVNKHALVVNGTPFQHHSLIPNLQEQADQIAAQVSRLPPGGIVSLSKWPLAVLIKLAVPKKKIPKWRNLTLVKERVVLPIQPARSTTEWHKTIVNGGNGYLPSKVLIEASFPLEPAFVITLHKAQGRTMKKVILLCPSATQPAAT
jgi:hypothetical protein